ncbi:hypothetical protein HELRODRAFT_163056 [Helobdella robusta]|uniref:Uncharacterized protein n=1 Tax=Helobdella robusta TaxID=6412 RepID=T1ETM0_HELRO|nr:hypothetical protein HELRODRAFT_163056 [Helobdella robusta]ESN96030.1 hypothetical protein HELRODRAFT_163056 [Helobdella robusta]
MAGRLEALIQLQKKINEYEVDFDLKRTLLENKFESVIKSLYEQRAKIISEDYTDNANNNAHSAWNANKSANTQTKDEIQGFWYEAFMNSKYVEAIIQETDRDALMYLTNVNAYTDISQLKHDRQYSFRLDFHFAPNPYFHNHVLTKTYFVSVKTDKDNPLHYNGPKIYKSVGCDIKWKTGMDLTVITSNKKNSSSVLQSGLYYQGALKKWYEKKGLATFFNFFNFPEIPENAVFDDEDASVLDDDFQLGWHIKDELIPQALFYYLGDISDDESDEESDEDTEGSSADSAESDEVIKDDDGIVEEHDRIKIKKPVLSTTRSDKKSRNV